MKKNLLFCFLIAFYCSVLAQDEIIIIEETNDSYIVNTLEGLTAKGGAKTTLADKLFFINEQDNMLFIDLSEVKNAYNLEVKNTNGDVVYTDVLADLPDGSIYEISLEKLGRQDFIVEFQTGNGTIKTELSLNKK